MESSLRCAAPAADARRGPRRAFTLVELLLTMALLVIISGVAWVGVQRPLARQRLRSAADLVHAEWTQARVDAMKSGHTYAFRYMLHGNRYHLGPQENPSATDSSSSSSAAPQSSAPDEEEMGDDPLPPPVDKTLPQGIRFLGPEGGSELATLGEGPATASADNANGWSEPIYFYADGSTSDARLLVAADRHSALRLQLRGITGMVTIDDDVTATAPVEATHDSH
jgi:prepilin-type N-terminal cleavage/methylation domain-containing protein